MSDAASVERSVSTVPAISTDRGDVIRFFASNQVAANLLMAFLLLGGLYAASQLNSQVFPDVDPGLIIVNVAYPGATPAEVEEGITRRVEEAVQSIEGVDRVVSVASENSGRVSIELSDFADQETVRDDVETAINQLIDFPPLDAEEPRINTASLSSTVMTLAVLSEQGELATRQAAARLEEELLKLPLVSLVALEGTRNYEISIEVSESALRQYGLTIGQVAGVIKRSSLNLSSGEIKTQGGDLLLRTSQKRNWGDEFNNIVIRALPDGTVLTVADVATVVDGFEEADFFNELNGKPCVFVRVSKSESESTLDIAAQIHEFLAAFELGEGFDVEVLSDESDILAQRLDLLIRNGVLGFALIVIFLVVMLDLKLAVWVAMGVPISFLGAMLFFDFLGVSYNMVSLFALIIVLGIVVDDAIVVGENIGAEQELGLRGVDAALAGVRGVFSPVFIGVVTTMTAFAPLLLATGTFGQILGVVPVVVITVLTMSLVEVFLILPAHLSHENRWSGWPLGDIQSWVAKQIGYFRDRLLIPVVAWSLDRKWLTSLVAILFLVGSFSLLFAGVVRFIFFPVVDSDSVRAELVFPVGTPYSFTSDAAAELKRAAYAVNEQTGHTALKSINVMVGGRTVDAGPGPGMGRLTLASNVASINLQLNPEPLNSISASEFARRWRLETADFAGYDQFTIASDFFTDVNSIAFELSHADESLLDEAIDFLMAEFNRVPALYEVANSFNLGKRQFDIALTERGRALGLTENDIARQLRQNFFGEEVHRIQRGRDELKVMVRYPADQRRSTRDFINTRIRLSDGTEVPFLTVATTTENRSYSEIERVDGRRVVTVSGVIDIAVSTPNEVQNTVTAEILPELGRRFPRLTYQAAGFSVEQAEDLGSIRNLGLGALCLIFVLLASQLRSYSLPLIILIGVPFGAAGAIMGHAILGFTVSFISIFGMVALSGVVVNDSLVLVDRYRRIRQATDLNPRDAIVEAVRRRFRPIFFTTATTALGLTPMLFEPSIQAQFLVPMAVSLATGIVFASVMIIFLVPMLLLVRENAFARLGWRTEERITPHQSTDPSAGAIDPPISRTQTG